MRKLFIYIIYFTHNYSFFVIWFLLLCKNIQKYHHLWNRYYIIFANDRKSFHTLIVLLVCLPTVKLLLVLGEKEKLVIIY